MEESRKYANNPNIFETIQNSAIGTLYALVRVEKVTSGDQFVRFSDEGTKRLDMIASSKIVSNKYNPDCKVDFTAGCLGLIKAGPSKRNQAKLWNIFRNLILNQCVDNAIVVRMVEYGMTRVKSAHDAQEIVTALYDALIPCLGLEGIERKPNADRYFVAIKAGFIEMSLALIVRFEDSSTTDLSIEKMLENFGFLLNGAMAVSLLTTTANAVSAHQSKIREALASVGKTEGKISALVEKVRSIVSINMETGRITNTDGSKLELCKGCLEAIPAVQIKLCSLCHQGNTFVLV